MNDSFFGDLPFLVPVQICLKSMNSLSGAESTTMLNTGWGWTAGRCGGKKADHQGFAVRQDQPHYSTPSPMEWSFTHLQGLKKAPSVLYLSIRNIRMMLRSISTNPAVRDLTPSTPSEVGHNAAEDEEGTGTVFGFFPASCFCLCSALVSAACVGVALVTTAVTFFISATPTLWAHQSALLHRLKHNPLPLLLSNVLTVCA